MQCPAAFCGLIAASCIRGCTCEELLHVRDGLEHRAFALALTAVCLRLLQLPLHLLQLLRQELPLRTACHNQFLISETPALEDGLDLGPKTQLVYLNDTEPTRVPFG